MNKIIKYSFWLAITDLSAIPAMDVASLLVRRLYPYKLSFATVVPSKGPDPSTVARIARLITVKHFAYRSDRKPAIVSVI